MSNESNQNKVDATAEKLAAALDQSSFTSLTVQLANKPEVKAAPKNVVKISDLSAKKKQAAKKPAKPVKNKALKKAAKSNAKSAAKPAKKVAAAAKKPAVKKAVKQVAKRIVEAAKKPAQAVAQAQNNFFKAAPKANYAAKQLSELAQNATEQAQKTYAQNAECAKQLLTAKSVSQVFEIQSKAARQRLEKNLNQTLKINEAIAESISQAFSIFASKK